MEEIVALGVLLGAGAAFAVGPIFVTILQEALTHGFWASLRVIFGSATADILLLFPAIAFTWVIGFVANASLWVGIVECLFFLYLSQQALRDARKLWQGESPPTSTGWAFGKGMLGNLVNPLSWTFWLATGTPTLLHAYHLGGAAGLALFTGVWFAVAIGLEAAIALAVTHSKRLVGPRGLACFTAASALLFIVLAGNLFIGTLLPYFLHK